LEIGVEDFSFATAISVSPESVIFRREAGYCAPAACCLSRTAARVRAKRAGTSFSAAHKLDDRRLHPSRQLREQAPRATGMQRERGAFLGGNHGVRHGAGAYHELLVSLLANSFNTLAVATGSGEMP